MNSKERIKVVNRDQSVANADGKSVAYGYTLARKPTGEAVTRSDGVYALESVGGIICGETGYVTGPAVQTLFAFIKDGQVGRSSSNNDIISQETTYVIPVFLDRYQKEVYIHTTNIQYV